MHTQAFERERPCAKVPISIPNYRVLLYANSCEDLENLIEEVQNPAGSFKDLSETLKIRKEINRWTTIEERAQIKGLEHTELDEKCRQFLACTDDKLKHPQSIYSVRNHIIHRFRVAVNQIELLDEINSLFELYLLDVLCRYTDK